MKKKILIIILGLLIVGGGVYVYLNNNQKKPVIEDTSYNTKEKTQDDSEDLYNNYKDNKTETCPIIKYDSYYFSELEKTFYYPTDYRRWEREDFVSFIPNDWDVKSQIRGNYPILYNVSLYDSPIGFIYEEDVKESISEGLDYHSKYMNNFENKPSKLFFDKTGDYYIECFASTECDKQICDYIIESI